MLNNLAGWHVVITLGVVLALVAFVVALVAVARRLAHRSSRLAPTPTADPVSQLEGLGRLRYQGLISEAEYETKRQDLLKRI